MKAVWASALAGVIFVGVAIREWAYRSAHPHALGPSGEIIALAIAGALVAFSVAALAYERVEREQRSLRDLSTLHGRNE